LGFTPYPGNWQSEQHKQMTNTSMCTWSFTQAQYDL